MEVTVDLTSPLARLEGKLSLVRDLVQAVAGAYVPGLYLYGNGGVGKSFTVLGELERLKAPYQLFNSRMSAKGLYRALERDPDHVHVLEDVERLVKDPDAQGVLRSALWAHPGHDRVCTWTTADAALKFAFRGGLILISNRPLADMPELRALTTRISVHCMDVTDAELVARMQELAKQGYRHGDGRALEPQACVQITDFLLQESRRAGCPLDLRLQVNGFRTYLQWQAGSTSCDWRDMLAAAVREAGRHFSHKENAATPEAKTRGRRDILRQIVAHTQDPKEQERLYQERTGASRADYYRRRAEVLGGELEAGDDGCLCAARVC